MSGNARPMLLALAALLLLVGAMFGGYQLWWHATHYVVERTDYTPPVSELPLEDDQLDTKNPEFDPELVDSRPLGDWQVNQSAAVIRLDCPLLKPDQDADLLVLRPSYRDAALAARQRGFEMLPSANLLDGAAKQFDDGLYAAVDLACYRGQLGLAPAAPQVIAEIAADLPPDSPACPFLAAALQIAGRETPLSDEQARERDRLLAQFDKDSARSEPISFYTWSEELREVWRFFRFLQHEFRSADLSVPREMAAVLQRKPELLEAYCAIISFYRSLTNPPACRSVADLLEHVETPGGADASAGSVAVFPPSTSRETELFEAVFPDGLPPGSNLMTELILRIRSGQVDLEPGESDGWYQYQVFALETLLLPSRGQENEKLLFTANYKRRLLEAFKALMTKRRETHARQLDMAVGSAAPLGASEVRPRLRLEPCVTFYLRTARAYAFLESFLVATAGMERLNALHGLRADGQRENGLADELREVRDRFYGFYLLACEDIGMRPGLLDGELENVDAARSAAGVWLDDLENHQDLACDTRVAVPIYIDPLAGISRHWGTLGVRLARLRAKYARPPKIRPLQDGGPWEDVKPHQLGVSDYVIAVDEFAEFELPLGTVLNRDDFRAMCDQHKTKAEIVRNLAKRP